MTRSEIRGLGALAERLLGGNYPGVLSTVIAVQGSSYRPLGSMMVSAFGSAYREGGISGGCLEEYVARQGHDLTASNPAVVLRFSTDPADTTDGMPTPGCGGTVQVLLEKLTPQHLYFLLWYSAAQERDVASVAMCLVDHTSPALTIERCFDEKEPTDIPRYRNLVALRQEALSTGRSVSKEYKASCSALAYHVRPLRRLVILGARDDSQPLCEMARALDWHVTVADRRARLATRLRFPSADVILDGEWWRIIRDVTFTPHTAVVIMTHSFEDDTELLPLLREKPFAYAGMLGPVQRKERIIAEAGLARDPAWVRRLRGPLGLDLGERSATGIAVAIVSEILAVLNGRDGDMLSEAGSTLASHPTPIEAPVCLSC